MVKTSIVSLCTRSKKPVLLGPLTFTKKRTWISATKVKNYFCDDKIVDWLAIKHHKEWMSYNPQIEAQNICNKSIDLAPLKTNQSCNELFNIGHAFEETVINYLKTKFNVISIASNINNETCEKSKQLMLQGVPILHSVPIRNHYNNTKGVIDLIIRSDYVNKVFQQQILSNEEEVIKAPKLNGDYHYIAFDIKYSTIPISKRDKSILNVKLFPAYKSQLWIYTQALSYIQGYTSRYAFLIGRRVKENGEIYLKQKSNILTKHFYIDKNDNIQFEPLRKAARIDYKEKDLFVITKTKEALKWMRQIVNNGENWTVDDLIKKNVFPNMCIDSGIYNKYKQEISKDIGEITSLWYCGSKERQNALINGISSWRDEKCTSEVLGIKGKRAEIIDKILQLNRSNSNDIDCMWPSKINNNLYNWKHVDFKGEIFIDVETINDAFIPSHDFDNESDFIFMIGIGWTTENKWNIQHIICNELTEVEEQRCLIELHRFLLSRNFPKVWFYFLEESLLKRKFKKYNIPLCNIVFADLYKLFIETPIIIKDCHNFKLKEIASAMNKHDMISLKNESENTTNGLVAMLNASRLYSENISNIVSNDIMIDIKKYNEYDCRLISEIINYLRKHRI